MLNNRIGGTSVFDPVLCELLYYWFSPENGIVIDPFAGGSVRGIIASKLNRHYIGIDLSREQIRANRAQATKICDHHRPVWHTADSTNISHLLNGLEADFLFSCPPYANLEVYSDNPKDLSTMPYSAFKTIYSDIIRQSCTLLKDNRFACFVVSEVRDKKGHFLGFVPDTIGAFKAAGLNYYNEIILTTQAGSLPMRARRPFEKSRKIGRTHQNVLVFVKGDARKATEAIGAITSGDLSKIGLNGGL